MKRSQPASLPLCPSCRSSMPTLPYGSVAGSRMRCCPRQLGYWKEQLTDLPIIELPADFQRPATPTFRGGVRTFQVKGPSYVALKELANRHSATMFMVSLAAFAVFLHRYTGQDDIVIGVPMANRNRRELAPLIGFFVNTLVFRIDCSGDPTFVELLQRVRSVTLEALSNQDVPFRKAGRRAASRA